MEKIIVWSTPQTKLNMKQKNNLIIEPSSEVTGDKGCNMGAHSQDSCGRWDTWNTGEEGRLIITVEHQE